MILSTAVYNGRTFLSDKNDIFGVKPYLAEWSFIMEENNVNNADSVKNVGLKVTGILLSIIGGIVLLAVIFSFTALPVIKYNNAEKNALAGDYATAARILNKMTYKDSQQKFGEYAFKAGEEFYNNGDFDNASLYLTYALKSENEEAAKKAEEYFKEDNTK